MKAALSGLWSVISAHPLLATAAAIGVILQLFDLFTVSANEARENLNNLKGEYENNEGELTSLNSELDTTRQRIDELQAKGTLTFTEKEELENLQNQNAELDRQKSLLESIQALKKDEVNKAFVQTMEKDVDNSLEYQGWGSEGPSFMSDRTRIDFAFKDYQYYSNLISKLDAQYADNLTDEDYLKKRQRYDEWRSELLTYLS